MAIGSLDKGAGIGRLKLVATDVKGPSSYTTGGFTVTIEGLSKIYEAVVNAGNGYLAEVASISGNTITIKVYEFNYPATAAGPATEVGAGTDLSGVTFRIIAVGE